MCSSPYLRHKRQYDSQAGREFASYLRSFQFSPSSCKCQVTCFIEMRTKQICWIHPTSLRISPIGSVTLPEWHGDHYLDGWPGTDKQALPPPRPRSRSSPHHHFRSQVHAPVSGLISTHVFHMTVVVGSGNSCSQGLFAPASPKVGEMNGRKKNSPSPANSAASTSSSFPSTSDRSRRSQLSGIFPPAAMLLEVGAERIDLRRSEGAIRLPNEVGQVALDDIQLHR